MRVCTPLLNMPLRAGHNYLAKYESSAWEQVDPRRKQRCRVVALPNNRPYPDPVSVARSISASLAHSRIIHVTQIVCPFPEIIYHALTLPVAQQTMYMWKPHTGAQGLGKANLWVRRGQDLVYIAQR